MIIKCKNCDTKFRVNGSYIGKHGRMLCCSVCEYEWLYIPNKETAELEEDNKPSIAKIPNKNIKNKLPTIIYSFIVFIILSLFLYIEREFLVDQHIAFEAIYRLFDYHNTEGLEVELFETIKEEYGDEHSANKQIKYKIPIKIINNSNKNKFVQTIKIIGYNENNNILNLSTNLRKDIPPHSELNVSICPDKKIDELDFIFVKIGNINDLKNFNNKSEHKKLKK
jgi:predicted Zn finger-like uncharacterized protein